MLTLTKLGSSCCNNYLCALKNYFIANLIDTLIHFLGHSDNTWLQLLNSILMDPKTQPSLGDRYYHLRYVRFIYSLYNSGPMHVYKICWINNLHVITYLESI